MLPSRPQGDRSQSTRLRRWRLPRPIPRRSRTGSRVRTAHGLALTPLPGQRQAFFDYPCRPATSATNAIQLNLGCQIGSARLVLIVRRSTHPISRNVFHI